MKSIKIVIIISLSFFLASCSGYQNYKGDNLVISAGNTASINMTADTFGGYDWIVASNSDETIAVFEGKETVNGEKKSDPSEQILKFKGLKKGKTIITLNYVKKGDLIAHKTRTINISVY